MLNVGEDLLICDMAETYHIYDMTAFPLSLVATLAAGLREDSRIKMKLSGLSVNLYQMLAALQIDMLQILAWQNTKDGRKGVNRPKGLYQMLTEHDDKDELMSFDTPEEYWEHVNTIEG